jgi:hypothetical protein
MPRDGSGNFTLASNTQAVSGDPISSTKYNTLVQDLEADANTDRPIVAGGTGASTASAARTNLGLEIGTNVQAYDAGLLSIAGLTTLADRSIYTTASDTYAVYTLTAAGRAILDDADASAQRTTLGLGTAAVKNTGTSGDAVPLLNAANTFTPLQTFTNPGNASFGAAIELKTTAGTDDPTLAIENYNGGSPVRYGISVKDDGALAFSSGRYSAALGTERMTLSSAGVLALGANTVWHAGNDGAGSGLDADTLDGVQGSAYAALAGSQTFTGLKAFEAGAEATNGARITNSATSRRLHLYSGKVGSQNGDLSLDAEDGNTVNIQTSGSNRATFTATQATFSVPAQIRPAASTETTGTLTSSSSNKTIQATGDITIPNAVFSAGDIILIYAGASSRTITEGASVTMRLGGTATTGSRTLAARGVAVLFFVSSSEVVVSGGAVT